MAQIKKDTTLRKSILQAAITGQLISDIGGESLPLAAAGKPSSATPSAGTSSLKNLILFFKRQKSDRKISFVSIFFPDYNLL